MAKYIIINGELYHYGVKGMKWGVRRYQNSDGSLTTAGKRRYGKEIYKDMKTASGNRGDLQKLARNISNDPTFKSTVSSMTAMRTARDKFKDLDDRLAKLENALSKQISKKEIDKKVSDYFEKYAESEREFEPHNYNKDGSPTDIYRREMRTRIEDDLLDRAVMNNETARKLSAERYRAFEEYDRALNKAAKEFVGLHGNKIVTTYPENPVFRPFDTHVKELVEEAIINADELLRSEERRKK